MATDGCCVSVLYFTHLITFMSEEAGTIIMNVNVTIKVTTITTTIPIIHQNAKMSFFLSSCLEHACIQNSSK